MWQPRILKQSHAGFTLLEMVIALTVMAILVSLAMPGMTEFGVKQKFIGAAEQLYGHLQQARSEAIARSAPMYVNFDVDGSSTWAYGVSNAPGCDLTEIDPTAAGACTISVDDGDGLAGTEDLVLMLFTSADHDGVDMDISGFPVGSTEIEFDQVRGTATGGVVELTSSTNLELNIQASTLGRIEICSPSAATAVLNYGGC